MKNDEFLVEKIGLTAIVYFRNVPSRDFVLERGGVARKRRGGEVSRIDGGFFSPDIWMSFVTHRDAVHRRMAGIGTSP